MPSSRTKQSGLQTSLFDEATLARGPLPAPKRASVPAPPEAEGRSTAVWRQWLSSMASDAEAALAAAIAYREMDAAGREGWLSSLEMDAPAVNVPKIALYAPLLAVESDPERRERLIFALGDPSSQSQPTAPQRALCGATMTGERVYVLASPLYLHFSQVLACGVSRGTFTWVRHDPIVGPEGVPKRGDDISGANLADAPMKTVLDDLASHVLSHQRSGRPLHDGLAVLGDLLGPLGP